MSYCRWSSDNFQCDIYAYESDNGYEIHVAGYKTVGVPPEVDFSLIYPTQTEESIAEYVRQSQANSKWLGECERVPIGLPYDGASFTLDTLDEFYDKLIELREIGYRFPDIVLKAIKE